LAWNCGLDEVGVKVQEIRLGALTVFDAYKVQSKMIFSTSDANVFLDAEELFNLVEVVLLDVFQT
jgi:hypothetical protein